MLENPQSINLCTEEITSEFRKRILRDFCPNSALRKSIGRSRQNEIIEMKTESIPRYSISIPVQCKIKSEIHSFLINLLKEGSIKDYDWEEVINKGEERGLKNDSNKFYS